MNNFDFEGMKETIITLSLVTIGSLILVSIPTVPVLLLYLIVFTDLNTAIGILYGILSEVTFTVFLILLGSIAFVIGINWLVNRYGK